MRCSSNLPSLLLLAVSSCLAQSKGEVRGTVVDATGAAIRAAIRVIQSDTGAVVLRLTADDAGAFEARPSAPGLYSLTAYAPGFRRGQVRNIRVESGQPVDLGTIRLDISGCDTPGTICDYFGPSPDDVKRIAVRDHVILQLSSTVDLDLEATTDPPKGADLRLEKQDGTLYLTAVNGAIMAPPDTSAGDCEAAGWTIRRLAVAGLGPGVDFCVKTNTGSTSHIFLTGDVENGTTELPLWYVTRKSR